MSRDLHPDELASGSVLVGLVMHDKSDVFWARRVGSGCTVCVCVWRVLFGNLAEKSSTSEFRLAVISPCTSLFLQICVLAELASAKHFVVLAWLRNEH